MARPRRFAAALLAVALAALLSATLARPAEPPQPPLARDGVPREAPLGFACTGGRRPRAATCALYAVLLGAALYAAAAATTLREIGAERAQHQRRRRGEPRTGRAALGDHAEGGPSRGAVDAPRHVLVVLGSGGHTTEMLRLLDADAGMAGFARPCDTPANGERRHERDTAGRKVAVSFVYAASDRRTPTWRARFETALPPGCAVHGWFAVPRARQVGQSWFTSAASAALALAYSARLLLLPWPGGHRRRPAAPDVLLCNGPGTCVPLCACALALRVHRRAAAMLGRRSCAAPRIVFVESVARVQGLSMSGRLLYRIADRFLVQWPVLRDKWPRCEYRGRLV